jgi:hypothetical protein
MLLPWGPGAGVRSQEVPKGRVPDAPPELETFATILTCQEVMAKSARFRDFPAMSEPLPRATIAAAEVRLRLEAIGRDEALRRALGKLESVLAAVADAMAGMTASEWAALAREERELVDGRVQMWSAGFGTAAPMLPALVLGNRVLELVAERHPNLTRDPPSAA